MKQATDEIDLFSSLVTGTKPFRNLKPCAEQANGLLICRSSSVYIKKNNMWWKIEASLFYLTTVSIFNGMECSSPGKVPARCSSALRSVRQNMETPENMLQTPDF